MKNNIILLLIFLIFFLSPITLKPLGNKHAIALEKSARINTLNIGALIGNKWGSKMAIVGSAIGRVLGFVGVVLLAVMHFSVEVALF